MRSEDGVWWWWRVGLQPIQPQSSANTSIHERQHQRQDSTTLKGSPNKNPSMANIQSEGRQVMRYEHNLAAGRSSRRFGARVSG